MTRSSTGATVKLSRTDITSRILVLLVTLFVIIVLTWRFEHIDLSKNHSDKNNAEPPNTTVPTINVTAQTGLVSTTSSKHDVDDIDSSSEVDAGSPHIIEGSKVSTSIVPPDNSNGHDSIIDGIDGMASSYIEKWALDDSDDSSKEVDEASSIFIEISSVPIIANSTVSTATVPATTTSHGQDAFAKNEVGGSANGIDTVPYSPIEDFFGNEDESSSSEIDEASSLFIDASTVPIINNAGVNTAIVPNIDGTGHVGDEDSPLQVNDVDVALSSPIEDFSLSGDGDKKIPTGYTCIGERMPNEVFFYRGDFICDKGEGGTVRYIFGLNLSGRLIYQDLEANTLWSTEEAGDHLVLKANATFILYDIDDVETWSLDCSEPIRLSPTCLPKYDCPFVHMNGDGVVVINWIDDDGVWNVRQLRHVFDLNW